MIAAAISQSIIHLSDIKMPRLWQSQATLPRTLMRLFGHKFFETPEWIEFMAVVQAAGAAHAVEPKSVLLSRASPEVSKVL